MKACLAGPDSGCDLPYFTSATSKRFDEVIIRKNANLSTSSMEYSSWHLLNRVTAASSAASVILNLSERRVDAVKSGSLRCADEFKQQENKSSENVRRQANLLS